MANTSYINIDTDERPPSDLQNFIDDSLEKPVNLSIPDPNPVPSWLPDIQTLSHDIYRYTWTNRVKYAVLCYSMANNGVVNLREMAIKYPKELKYAPRDYTGFPDFVEMSGANEDTFLKMDKVAKEVKALTDIDEKSKGPYLEYDSEKEVFRAVHELVLDATALSYGRLFPNHTTMTCRPKFIYNYCIPADIITEAEKKKGVELFDSGCDHVADRLITRITEGHVKEVAASCFFDSGLFKDAFFRRLEKHEKTTEVLQAFDKDSASDKPKSLLYCLVAQSIPKNKFLIRYLQEFDKVKLPSNMEKEKQVFSSLGAACCWGHFETYKILIENYKETLPFDVFRKAVIGGNNAIVESLLTKQKWSQFQLDKALEWACFYGVDLIYSSIRDSGANPSDVCLFESAIGGSVKIFTDLCQQGYDYEALFGDGRTAFHAAVAGGSIEIVEFLLQRGVEPHLQTTSGKVPLLLAAEKGQDDVAERLLMIGGDPNIRDANQSTALHKACLKGSYRLFERLLNVGGDMQALDENGATIFHKAVFGGNREIIDHLLKSGFQIDRVDSLDNSVSHFCAVQGHLELLEDFVDRKPSLISSLNKFHWNPVMCAAYAGHVKTFDFLAQNGGDIAQVTVTGQDVLHLAKDGRQRREEKEQWFSEIFSEFIHLGSLENYDRIIQYLVKVLKHE